VPAGAVLPLDDETAIVKVKRTQRPARLDGYEGLSGALAETLRSVGIRSSVAAPVVVDGRLWGAVTASTTSDDLFPEGAEHRLGRFAELVAQAIANAEANDELRASRARLVEAAHDERRRIERNLHDGAQQRLVALSLTLRLAQGKLETDPDATAELLAAATGELAQALEELRELARGIHPAILSDRGLSAALQALATRAPLPVELVELPEERLPEAVEAAAYYVVAEGLTNVAKYAQASAATVRVARRNGTAVVEIADDGVGGADATLGSGLRGLADRVEALDGHIEVSSEPGTGTTIRAAIPCSAA
jgi:signal transduction histidine kinase